MQALKIIAQQINNCTLCPLHQYRILAVPGEGSSDARVMFIGEAPGAEEDRQGRPFVGRAGKILNEALCEAGINRDSVFITSVVKCRPPDNRVPHQSEIRTCVNHYLTKQIISINPAIICLLGNTAANALLGPTSLAEDRGRLIGEMPACFVTYHPAAAGRSRKWKDAFFADIKNLATLM
jgi:uracil-DNA glycosylase family 4